LATPRGLRSESYGRRELGPSLSGKKRSSGFAQGRHGGLGERGDDEGADARVRAARLVAEQEELVGEEVGDGEEIAPRQFEPGRRIVLAEALQAEGAAVRSFTSGPLAFNRPITRIARPKQKTTMKLTPIDNPPARPNPHPICLLIPSADEYELQDLTDDIRAHGLIDPIVLFEGMILDGRNRAAACERAGVVPRYVQFGGGREDALILVVSHNLKRRHLTKQAVADALVAAEDFNLHYTLAEPAAKAAKKESTEEAAGAPEAKSVIKITEPKTASSRKLAEAAGGVVSHAMIAATRKVKEKGEPELQEAVKRGRIGVQDAAKAADLSPEQQKAIATSPKPRRAATEAAEAAKIAAARTADAVAGSERNRHAALRKAWEGAKALRGLWETADDRTKEWFVGAVLFEFDEAAEADRAKWSAIDAGNEP
jgi:ParB-like chromosome segregation protein Spo0J